MLSINRYWNSCTSLFFRFPRTNSFHAASNFSPEVISSYVCASRMPLVRPPPSRVLLPLLDRIKSIYFLWHEYHSILPKIHRYSLGNKIDNLYVESMEAVSAPAFLGRDEKRPYVRLAARKVDT